MRNKGLVLPTFCTFQTPLTLLTYSALVGFLCSYSSSWLVVYQSSQLFILLIHTSAWSTHWLVVYGVEVLGPFKCLLAFRADKAFYMPLLVKGPQRPVCDGLTASSTLWKNRVCVAMITIWLSLPLPVTHRCCELGKAAKADKMFWVPRLVHCSNAI